MRYITNAAFRKTLKRLSSSEQLQIKQRIDLFVRAFEARELPAGLGLKQLRPKLWEIRRKFFAEYVNMILPEEDQPLRGLVHKDRSEKSGEVPAVQ